MAGGGRKGYGGDGGPAAEARFGDLYCVAFDAKGERLYLADLDNRRIRVIDLKTGIVATAAGNGQRGVRFAKELIAGQFLILTARPQDRRDPFTAGEVKLAVSRQRAGRIVAADSVLPDQFAGLGVEASRDTQR